MKRKLIQIGIVILGFIVLSYATFPEVLGGKIVNQSDIAGWQGMSHEMMEWNEQNPDNETAWTDSMFGGMPTTTIHSSTKGDWTQGIYDFFLIGRRPATYFFVAMLGAFLLFLAFGVNIWIAALGALAVSFCSYNFQIIQVGHNTKMQAIAFMPWVLAALVYTFKAIKKEKWFRRTILGAALFGLSLSFQIKANHPQISYYLAIIIVIYSITCLVDFIKNHKSKLGHFAAACGLLLTLGGVGIATNAIKLLPTLEYTPYSMRGGSSDGEAKGLEIDYATAWSYGWEELPNLLVPNFNGGSSAGQAPANSEAVALLKASGQKNIKQVSKNLPYYWGPQPFTAGPMYIGAVSVFLFVLGLCVCRTKDKWWIALCSLLAVFLALGSHFMGFTRFFYDFVPLYNKFRTVSMALVVLQITLPLLGFLMLDKFIKEDTTAALVRKKGWIAAVVTGGFALICAIVPGIAGDFSAAGDGAYPDVLREAFEADRRSLLRGDAFGAFLLIGMAYLALLWGTAVPKGAVKSFETQLLMRMARRRSAAIVVGALAFVSLFVVGKRYLGADDFVSEKSFKNQFDLRAVDEMILEDTAPSYRVLDLTVNVFNDSHPSYWHKNIGGYSPAKLQRYQEYIDSHLLSEINSLYSAIGEAGTISEAEAGLPYLEGLANLNCKYIIIGEDYPPLEYGYAKGAAWFDGDSGTGSNGGSSIGAVELVSYEPNRLVYSYSCIEASRVVFSEVYYPKGWSLVVEETGQELEIELWGELFRSAIVPAGEGTLVMRFEPQSYVIGEKVSRASSILLIFVVLGAAVMMGWPRLKPRNDDGRVSQ